MIASVLLLGLGLVAAAGIVNALRPSRHPLLFVVSWIGAWITVELAAHMIVLSGVAAAFLVALGALDHTVGVIGLVLLGVCDLVAALLFWRALRTVVVARNAVAELDPDPATPRYPRSHVVFPPLALRRKGVHHERGVVYARRGSYPLKLDVYMPTAPAVAPRPAIVQVHGGGWVGGTRKEQGIPLLNHLAANGWVGFNISYRLGPFATWPDPAVDIKQAIAWIRENAGLYDVDPSFIAITGGSAGGHLSAFVALTADDRSLQPGFEDADTSVGAAVPFYGVYDLLDEGQLQNPMLHWVLERYLFKALRADEPQRFRDASPVHRIQPGAPPFFVIHGDHDSLTPVRDARRFAAGLRDASLSPVLYAEMHGGQHAFDLIPSPRTAPVIEAVERFLHTIHTRRAEPAPAVEREAEEAVTA